MGRGAVVGERRRGREKGGNLSIFRVLRDLILLRSHSEGVNVWKDGCGYGLMSYQCCYRSSNVMKISVVHRHSEHKSAIQHFEEESSIENPSGNNLRFPERMPRNSPH